jgi:hypothetical protein
MLGQALDIQTCPAGCLKKPTKQERLLRIDLLLKGF